MKLSYRMLAAICAAVLAAATPAAAGGPYGFRAGGLRFVPARGASSLARQPAARLLPPPAGRDLAVARLRNPPQGAPGQPRFAEPQRRHAGFVPRRPLPAAGVYYGYPVDYANYYGSTDGASYQRSPEPPLAERYAEPPLPGPVAARRRAPQADYDYEGNELPLYVPAPRQPHVIVLTGRGLADSASQGSARVIARY